jgi:hypothetical protein
MVEGLEEQMYRVYVKFKPGEIKRMEAEVRGLLKMTHRLTSSDIAHDFSRAFKLTKMTTMVATGATRESMFAKINKPAVNGSSFLFGYGPTKNNQSVEQELGTGRTHHSERSHYDEYGYPKCSRTPNDIYASYGRYTSNPRARRKAMRLAIEGIFKTSGDLRMSNSGVGDLQYTSGFKRYTDIRSTKIAKLYRALGVS